MDDETPLLKQAAFYFWSRLVFVTALYGYAIFREWKSGELSAFGLMFDAILFALLFFIWLAFFAQFVLPVRS